MLVSDFDFDLPEELIAQEPAPRGTSRLLVLERSTGLTHQSTVGDLPSYLRAGDLLVVNDTRVFAARLLGVRVPSGGAVECLLLSRPAPDESGAFTCDALVHPGQKLKPGARVRFEGPDGAIEGEILERRFFGRRRLRLHTAPASADIGWLIDRLGHMPLPPYIRRADTAGDRERYQTIFANAAGSIAAPTAGLHFTPALLEALDARGVERTAITLHVGYGTFKPIRADVVEAHVVDPEHYDIDAAAAEAINRARRERRRVVAVGTTTTRALEDSGRRGNGEVRAGAEVASTFIYPGFEFQIISALMTNFHLPRSSLLLLVAAFAGRDLTLASYRDAVEAGYRFYSYGDAMLVT